MWLILLLFARCIVVGGGARWPDGIAADGYRVYATPDKPAIISCSIASKNLTKFTWRKSKKGVSVYGDWDSYPTNPRWINETYGTMELYFTSVRPEDYGGYRCTAEKNFNITVWDDIQLVEYQTDRIWTVGMLEPESIYIKWEFHGFLKMKIILSNAFSFQIEYRQNSTDGWLRTPLLSSPERIIHAGSFRIDELEPSTVYEINGVILTAGGFDLPARRVFSRWVTTSDVEYVPTVRWVNKTTDTVRIGWSQPPPELRQSIDAYMISVESGNKKEKHFRLQKFKADEGNEAIIRLSPSISYDLVVRACFGDFCPDRRASDVVRGVTTDDTAGGKHLRARQESQSDMKSSELTMNVTRDAEDTIAGSEASFTCSVSVQGYEGWWTKEGERLTFFSDSDGGIDWTIVVGDAGGGNARDYTCVAKMIKDSHRGGRMLVTVIPPAEELIVGAEIVYAKPRERTALLCDFFGYGRSNFEWRDVSSRFESELVGVPVTLNLNRTHVRMMLYIALTSTENSYGKYECQAMNYRLPIKVGLVRLEVSDESPLQLSASVIGSKLVFLRWFDKKTRGDTHLIRFSERHSLERENVFSVRVEEGKTYNRYVMWQVSRGTFYWFELVVISAGRRLASTYSGLITPAKRDLTYFPNITVISKTINSIIIGWPSPPEELRAHVNVYRITVNYTYNGTEIVDSNYASATYYEFQQLHPSTSHDLEVSACFSNLSTDCYSSDVRREVFTESVVESGTQVEIWLPLTGISFLLAILGAWRFYKKAQKRRILRERLAYFYTENPTSFNPELSMNDQADLLPYDKEWEFPRKLLRLDEELGSGSFGIVWKARAKTIRRPEAISVVAVKTVRPTASLHCMKALLRELKILVYLGHHPNIVSLLGACTKNLDYGQLLVIVEFCRFGNLHDYLWRCRSKFVDELCTVPAKIPDPITDDYPIDDRSRSVSTSSSTNSAPCWEDAILAVEDLGDRTDQRGTSEETGDLVIGNNSQLPEVEPPTKYPGDFTNAELDPVRTRDLVSWAWQISRGMQYLAAKKVLHGDLAARNVLLLEENVVKICDFGLSKSLQEDDQYKDEGNDPLPVKWMAIESLRDGIFSVKTDVWSFGVLLWELFSLAKTPYPEINPQDMCETLVGGYRMERPKYSPETIYRMMLQCWEANPSKRPTFVELEHSIGDLMEETVKMHYIQLYTRRERAYARITEFRNKRDPENQDPIPPDPTEPTNASQDETVENTPFRMRFKQFFCRG